MAGSRPDNGRRQEGLTWRANSPGWEWSVSAPWGRASSRCSPARGSRWSPSRSRPPPRTTAARPSRPRPSGPWTAPSSPSRTARRCSPACASPPTSTTSPTPTSWSRPSPSASSSRPRCSARWTRCAARRRSSRRTPRRCRSPSCRCAPSGPRQVVGMHFFNPAPVQKLVEVVRTVVTDPEVLSDVTELAVAAGQEPGGVRRPRRLHRQQPALHLPQPGRGHVRGPLRRARGPRRGHALRLRLPDGPARADGPHRPRHGVRDPRHDVQAVAQPAPRAGPDPQADDHRRPAGPEVRARLLHLRRPRARPRSSRTR